MHEEGSTRPEIFIFFIDYDVGVGFLERPFQKTAFVNLVSTILKAGAQGSPYDLHVALALKHQFVAMSGMGHANKTYLCMDAVVVYNHMCSTEQFFKACERRYSYYTSLNCTKEKRFFLLPKDRRSVACSVRRSRSTNHKILIPVIKKGDSGAGVVIHVNKGHEKVLAGIYCTMDFVTPFFRKMCNQVYIFSHYL